jgi:hypothetical protein
MRRRRMAEVIFRLPGREQYSYAEVKFTAEEYAEPGPIGIQEQLAEALAYLNGTFPGSSGGSNSGAAQSGPSQQSNNGGHNCVHGPMNYVKGGSGNRTWQAYMCQNPDKSNRCKPIDAITGQPWK